MFHLKIYLQKSGVTNTQYINLVETMIRHQNLRVKYRESPRSCVAYKYSKELLTSGVIFDFNSLNTKVAII